MLCSKTDRRGRMVAHILKYHVSMDRVPYSCSLCNFRCQDTTDLLNHTRRYKRHVEEVKRNPGIPLSRALNKAEDPVVLDESYMKLVPGSRLDQAEDPLEDMEHI